MASMGSIFRVNIITLGFEELQKLFPQHIYIWQFFKGENIGSIKFIQNSIIVIGNESNGVSKDIKETKNRN